MLTPNSPIGRLQYVIKQYDGTKNQYILPDAIRVSLYMFGRDRAADELGPASAPPLFDFWEGRPGILGSAYDHAYELRVLKEWLGQQLPPTHEWDAVVPWVARELGRLYKAVRKGHAMMSDYDLAVDELEKKAAAIAMWSDRDSVDLNRTSLAEALQAVETFEIEVDAKQIPQGITVMEFDDGYTIQSLVEEDQLAVEGEVMQHCVGGYCMEVQSGNAVIFSLRAPNGAPHATIEWQPPEGHALGRDVQLDPMVLLDPQHENLREVKKSGRFVQIRGKQNDIPAEKYRTYIQDFIKKYFDADPLGMLMVALPGQQISFSGHTVTDFDFSEDVPVNQAKWAGGEFINCQWPELEGADFDGCTLGSCRFEEDLFDCAFAEVDAHDVEFMGGYFKDCIFDGSSLSQTSFGLHQEVEIERCSFEGTNWFNSAITAANIINSDFVNGQMKFTALSHVTFRNCDMSGFEIDQHSSVRSVDLENMDLSDVSYDTVTRLLETVADDLQVAIESVQGDVELPEGYEAHVEDLLSANRRPHGR